MTPEARELAYNIPWRSSAIRTGIHRSNLYGSGGRLRDIVPLMVLPDPRRIAIRASLSDPFERLLVKRTEQPNSINICVLVDVSASMAFRGNANKLQMAADFAEAIAWCTQRVGDSFALFPFDNALRSDLVLRKTMSRAAQSDAIERLRAHVGDRPGARGVCEAAGELAGRKKLVFLISDFLWPKADAERAAAELASNDVVPIELEDSLQAEALPRWGLLNLRDLETGRRRLIAMRPALRERWQLKREEHRRLMRRIFGTTARQMFSARDRIDWMKFTSYLLYGSV